MHTFFHLHSSHNIKIITSDSVFHLEQTVYTKCAWLHPDQSRNSEIDSNLTAGIKMCTRQAFSRSPLYRSLQLTSFSSDGFRALVEVHVFGVFMLTKSSKTTLNSKL